MAEVFCCILWSVQACLHSASSRLHADLSEYFTVCHLLFVILLGGTYSGMQTDKLRCEGRGIKLSGSGWELLQALVNMIMNLWFVFRTWNFMTSYMTVSLRKISAWSWLF